ncbi:MAG: sulfite exporter TauE/SafE family protein, partial [Alphaproteobacteria bacterium]|nr:sulfite exporter TauE/SafE family protein [Alphaproteobacteria bacterium]
VGSDVAHAVPLTFVAGFGHWLQGSVDLKLLASLLIGSVPGILIGSYLVPKLPEIVLRLILAAILLVVSARFLIQ